MRVLFASTAGEGHFGPMVPLAKACLAAGHEVRVAAPESFARTVTASGFVHAAFGDVAPEDIGPVMGQVPSMTFAEANRTVIQRVFADLDARAAFPGMTRILGEWQPDLVVREPAEFGSLLASLAAGVPAVQVAIGMRLMEDLMLADLEEPLASLDAEAGLAGGASIHALQQMPTLSFVPAMLDDADLTGHDETLSDFPRAATRGTAPLWRFRSETEGRSGSLPAAWGNPDLPLVYVSFGSIAGSLGPFGGVFEAAIDAMADRPYRVLMTTGRGLDSGRLPPLPSNVKVEAWWPQADVLPHSSVVVGHGGFGTTMGALAAGVPQVVIPLFTTDQLVNAIHVAGAGAGEMLPDWTRVDEQLAQAVRAVSSDPEYRRSAERVAAAMAALPPVADAVPLLAELAAGRIPAL